MTFTELQLHPDLRMGVEEAGYVTCMPVQAQVFPHAFSGEDIYAQSQTGTGKTAAFLVSIYQRILMESGMRNRKVLILAPTRELAVQILEEAQRLGKHLPVTSGAFFGGVGYGPQLELLRADVQIIVGTPGRIIDLIQQGKMLLRDVGFLVIDEADRMFDMGFIDDLRRLLRYLPPPEKRQTFLFSATLGERVRHLAWDYMREPKEIVIEPENVTVDLVTQVVHHVSSGEKLRLLLGILRKEKPGSAIIFCNQKNMVEEVARRLNVNGIPCDFIMGDLPQVRRLEIIQRLKSGTLGLLVATDVAARGLDIDSLDMVINYDVPLDTESYVHRIGRTARAGKSGRAVTLACERFVYGLPAIEDFIHMKISVAPYDPGLLEEDKSAGMHFGYGRDRGRDGSGRRGARDGRREPRREGRSASRGGHGTPGHPSRIRPAPERRPDTLSGRRPVPAEPGLYTLPLEDRIRHFKEKHGGRQPP
ncbi:MAG TPA: DEAD/DEAH box helicase, partial [Magnetospirillaceae bacterium]|nr:DEAD/DEAH box helicase [Magnetospirillaceae bacterium]